MGKDSEASNQGAFNAARVERDRTLTCVRELEDALSRAAGGTSWVDDLKASLQSLQDAMAEEQRELGRTGSLLTLISAERPRRFGPRVRGIREQYDDVARQLDSFRRQLDRLDGAADIGDLRHRAGWIIRALHNCRSRQADLVFDALGLDLGDNHGE